MKKDGDDLENGNGREAEKAVPNGAANGQNGGIVNQNFSTQIEGFVKQNGAQTDKLVLIPADLRDKLLDTEDLINENLPSKVLPSVQKAQLPFDMKKISTFDEAPVVLFGKENLLPTHKASIVETKKPSTDADVVQNGGFSSDQPEKAEVGNEKVLPVVQDLDQPAIHNLRAFDRPTVVLDRPVAGLINLEAGPVNLEATLGGPVGLRLHPEAGKDLTFRDLEHPEEHNLFRADIIYHLY